MMIGALNFKFGYDLIGWGIAISAGAVFVLMLVEVARGKRFW